MATLIDGKAISQQVRAEVAARAAALAANGLTPGLAVVLVGDDPASQTYVRNKGRACAKAGIASFDHRLPGDTPQHQLLALIEQLNADPAVHGILVQMPVPAQIDAGAVIEAIAPDKDVDGFHPMNVGRLAAGLAGFVPCTPLGIQRMLTDIDIELAGQHVVIVGRSDLVGKPLANLLMQKAAGANATVTVCHSRTRDLPAITRSADVLVAAIGVAEFVRAEMVRDGAVVVDVGINRVDDPSARRGYRLVGDVAFDEVAAKAAAITPVPGGVGPMTIAMLLHNVVTAAARSRG